MAIPVLNGGKVLFDVLSAVRRQTLGPGQRLEILICDSGSSDGSIEVARRAGARVELISRREFSHGATRNLLMSRAAGDHVAFLTQDAVPAASGWLRSLLRGFTLAENVGLVFGPYIPRPGANLSVRRELQQWFASLAPDGQPRIDQLSKAERQLTGAQLYGRRSFFTDANGCISRAAWERVPFRDVPYAEDHALAQDMLRTGFAKVFVPDAPVVHSHEYQGWEWLRRSFDEARAVQQVYELDTHPSLRELILSMRAGLFGDIRFARHDPKTAGARLGLPLVSLQYHGARTLGIGLGARSNRLPAWLVRRLSLEGRG